jgi:predicted O-methyltransferase YrrM
MLSTKENKMGWDKIEGWFDHNDAQFVKNICSTIHDGIVVELGFFAGRCTAAMAPICKINDNEYYAIDNCKGANPRDPATKAQQSRNMKEVFETNMRGLGIWDYLQVHEIDSAASSQLFGDGEVDFCFVDASHVAEDVKRDIEAWWPKIKPGGTLGGHDYSWGSVRGVTNKFAQENGLKLVVDGNCWKVCKDI